MNSSEKLISVVLGSYNRNIFLRLTIDSIRHELASLPHEIIVVEGGSTDGALEWLIKQKDVITIAQHNRGSWKGKTIERRTWGYFMNLGFKSAQGKYVCMLSDDCLIVPGAIHDGIALFEKRLGALERVGGIAFYMRNWPEELKYYVHYSLEKTISIDHGLYLRSALEEVGYIDEQTYLFYYGDIDLALKLWQKGYKIIASPTSFIEHSTHADIFTRKTNYSKSYDDFVSFKNKWRHDFPFHEIDVLHRRLEIESSEPSNTARKLSIAFQLRHLNFKYVFARLKRQIRIRERLGQVKDKIHQ